MEAQEYELEQFSSLREAQYGLIATHLHARAATRAQQDALKAELEAQMQSKRAVRAAQAAEEGRWDSGSVTASPAGGRARLSAY